MSRQTLNRLVIRDRIVRVDRLFKRFDLSHRLEHIALIVSVSVLLVTGLPQKYSHLPVSVTLIGWLGGIQSVRLIHRTAAILLALEAIVHVISTAYRFVVLRLPPHMLLLASDLRDLLQGVRHRLGRAKEPPDMGRYTYYEKLLYWAVVWSVAALGITGLVMWNPITPTRFLSGQVIPAAKRAHGSEALLLLMVGVGWHVWHVAVKQRNWSMFTGQMTETDMIRHHPLEWDAIMDGRDRLPLDVTITRHRRRRFILMAAPLTLVAIGLLAAYLGLQPAAVTTVVVTNAERQPLEARDAAAIITLPVEGLSPGGYPAPVWIDDIQPLLVETCGECHNEEEGLNLTDYDGLVNVVVPGDPSQSELVAAQASGDHPGQLTGDELATVIIWIGNGAPR
jgi:cytochrome b subunit of formate dehydrogenase